MNLYIWTSPNQKDLVLGIGATSEAARDAVEAVYGQRPLCLAQRPREIDLETVTDPVALVYLEGDQVRLPKEPS